MIRVLHVIGKMDRAGAETMLMNLYRNIDREKIQFDFMVHTAEKCAYDDEIISLGGNIYHIPKFNGPNFITYVKAWNNFFKQHGEHTIVHGHIGSSAAIYLSIANKHGKFTIAHSHATADVERSVKTCLWNLCSYPTRFISDYYLACSKQAGIDRFGKKIVDSNKFKVLNNAIDLEKYAYSDNIRVKIRSEFGISDKFILGHAGRFAKVKNHEFVIDVFYNVQKHLPNSVLMLVGDGNLKTGIIDKARELGILNNIIFTGVREDVPNLLQAMDVFVFPSFFEGLGIVAVEAQAAGLHTICSDALPTEARVTDLFHPLPLSAGAEKWADEILKYADGYERKNMHDTICRAGYDIHQTAEWLEEFYVNNVKDL